MTRRPPSLRRLAILLTLPVLLVAGMGVWVIQAEQARLEGEWRTEAERRRDALLAELPAEVLPRVYDPAGSALQNQLAEAGRLLPRWLVRGMDPPAPGESWALYEECRQLVMDGKPDEAQKLEAALWMSGSEEFSPSGTPLTPLIYRLKVQLAPAGERQAAAVVAANAAIEYPSALTLQLVEDLLPQLPDAERGALRAEAEAAALLFAEAEALGRQNRAAGLQPGRLDTTLSLNPLPVPGQWTAIGLVRSHSSRWVQVLTYKEVSRLLQPLVQRFTSAAAGGLEFLPDIEWHGVRVHAAKMEEVRTQRTSPFTPAVIRRGVEFAAGTKGAWSVFICAASPEALAAAVAERTNFLKWVLANVLLAVAVAMWMTFRAFKKQAELARMQGEFVASVSHELRTPVAGIRALAERLESGTADAAQTAEYHRMIAREGRRLAALVDNVLDFSRIERGAKAYDLDHADLPRLIRDTADLLRPVAEEKGLTLVEEIADVPEDRWPAVDAVALRQALVNLLDNAIKFTPPGGTVTVGFSASRAEGQTGRRTGSIGPVGPIRPIGPNGQEGQVCIFVKDTGIGIPAAEQARIFEKFYRVDNGLRRETTGAGIGLSIVKHIAEAHGARVTVESEPGKGAAFTVAFGS